MISLITLPSLNIHTARLHLSEKFYFPNKIRLFIFLQFSLFRLLCSLVGAALWCVLWCSKVPGWTLSFSVGQLRRSGTSLPDVLLAEFSQHGTVLLVAPTLVTYFSPEMVQYSIVFSLDILTVRPFLLVSLEKGVAPGCRWVRSHQRVELLFRQKQTRTACCWNSAV